MATVKFKLDPKNPPKLSAAAAARLGAMTPDEIEAGAASDPDNPPLTAVELDRLSAARLAKAARVASGFSQAKFAEVFRINVARLRDMEQGRFKQPDSALVAYLTVIARDFRAVIQALAEAP